MGLKDVFSRHSDDAPEPGQPGAASQPQDLEGDGPVTLEDRTAPGGQGSPDTNQGRAEPTVPATTEHPTPATPAAPSLEDMSIGTADPQLPRHPAAAHSGLAVSGVAPGVQSDALSGIGLAPAETRPTVSSSSTGRGVGPANPLQDTAGMSHRAPGLQGSSAPGEAVETDVEAGAARMGPAAVDTTDVGEGHGETGGVPASGSSAAPGTSEEHGVVHGIRMADAREAPEG